MFWIIELLLSTTGFGIVVTLLFIYKIWNWYNYEDPFKSQGVPIAKLGFSDAFFKDPVDAHKDLKKKHGKSYVTSGMGMTFYNCTDPDVIKDVLVHQFETFNYRGFDFTGEPVFEDMLSGLHNLSKWKRIRSVMSPTFSTGKLRQIRLAVDDCIDMALDNIEEIKKDGKVDVKPIWEAFAMDVVTQTAFGIRVNSLVDKENPVVKHATKFFKFDFNPFKIMRIIIYFTMPRVARLFNLKMIDQDGVQFYRAMTNTIIEEKRKQKNLNQKRCDFLQLMLDACESKNQDVQEEEEDDLQRYSQDGGDCHKITTHNKTLSNDEIIAQCVLFFIAGVDTSSSTISYACHLLAVDQTSQQRLFNEIKSTIGKQNELTYDNVMSIKFLDAVISETQRLYPTAGNVMRMSKKETVLSNGVKLPAGCVFQVPLIELHRDEDHFDHPDEFKPDRFMVENRDYHPFAYLPFGAGPRNCVAMRFALMNVKLALARFVLEYRFELPEGTSKTPKTNAGKTLTPKEVIMRIEKRN